MHLTRCEATGTALLSGFTILHNGNAIAVQAIDYRFNSCYCTQKAKDCPGTLRKVVNAILFAEYGPRKLARRMWLFGEKT